MDISLAWIRDPRTPLWLETEGRKYLGAIHVEMLVDFVHLTSEAQLKGIRGHYPALKGALDAMGRVVDWIHREQWEAEQSQLARAGAPMCSICMEYGHVEANCHDQEEDTDSDLEWEELEVQSEAEELLSQEEEPWHHPVTEGYQTRMWEAEQSQLARAGAPMCSICMEYGHVEANCHDQEEDTDSDLEWEELEVQSEAEELLSQEEEPWQCPEPLPRQFTGGGRSPDGRAKASPP
ncbi:UNVERIFIED_CONTAM: hypothetical protein FKN15_007300 [Acipenser sinensis]